MDFLNDKYIQSLAGGNDLTYLMSHSLEGLMKIIKNPFVRVSFTISLYVLYAHACSLLGLVRISRMLRQLSSYDRLESTASGRD